MMTYEEFKEQVKKSSSDISDKYLKEWWDKNKLGEKIMKTVKFSGE